MLLKTPNLFYVVAVIAACLPWPAPANDPAEAGLHSSGR